MYWHLLGVRAKLRGISRQSYAITAPSSTAGDGEAAADALLEVLNKREIISDSEAELVARAGAR